MHTVDTSAGWSAGRLRGSGAKAVRVATLGTCIWQTMQQVFGLLFTVTVAWGVCAFPVYKQMADGFIPVVAGLVLACIVYRRAIAGRIERVLARPSERTYLFLAVGGAVVVRVIALLLIRYHPISDHAVYEQHALSMLQGNGYGSSAYFPPGMAFLIYGIYAVFGRSIIAVQLANALVGGLLTWLTYDVGKRVVSAPAARLAGLMAAFFPSLVIYSITFGYGPLLCCAIFGCASLFLRRGKCADHPWRHVALIGALIGVASLLKPICLLLPAVFGLSYLRWGAPLTRSLRNVLVMTLFMGAVITPWTVRNYLVLGAFVPGTTTGGINLWLANNPQATGLPTDYPPFALGTTEIERDRWSARMAVRYVLDHPHRFAALQLPKAAYMWGTSSTSLAAIPDGFSHPAAERAVKAVINTAWVFICFFFIVAICRDGLCKSTIAFWPVVCLLAYVWGVHLFFVVQSRYHLAIIPVLFIGAAAAILRRPARDLTAAEV